MFLLHEIIDTLRVEPCFLGDDKENTLADLIELKYGNKILMDVGFVIGLHSIITVGESFIHPGDGGIHTDVKFDLMIFRPFEGKFQFENVTDVYLTCDFRRGFGRSCIDVSVTLCQNIDL